MRADEKTEETKWINVIRGVDVMRRQQAFNETLHDPINVQK